MNAQFNDLSESNHDKEIQYFQANIFFLSAISGRWNYFSGHSQVLQTVQSV